MGVRFLSADDAREAFVGGFLRHGKRFGLADERESNNAHLAECIFAGIVALEQSKSGLPVRDPEPGEGFSTLED